MAIPLIVSMQLGKKKKSNITDPLLFFMTENSIEV